MIDVTVYCNQKKEYVGFATYGHADYADAGEDIICAAVSSLVINAMNSIEKFTDDDFSQEVVEETGDVKFLVKANPISSSSQLLLKSLVLGLQLIESQYGTKYLTVKFRNQEV